MREVSKEGLGLIRFYESFRGKAYQDSGGVWTIGYGHTEGVRAGQTCTQEEAEDFLQEDTLVARSCVVECVAVPLMQFHFDALVSFVFNVGCGAFRKSTLLKKLNKWDYKGAAEEFKRWNKAGRKVLAGLTRRRKAEAELFRRIA